MKKLLPYSFLLIIFMLISCKNESDPIGELEDPMVVVEDPIVELEIPILEMEVDEFIFNKSNSILIGNEVLGLYFSANGILYINTRKSRLKLYQLDISTLTLKEFSNVDFYERTGGKWVTDNRDDILLIGSFGYPVEPYGGGLIINNGSVTDIYNPENSILTSSNVNVAKFITTDKLLVGLHTAPGPGPAGLFEFNIENNQWKELLYNQNSFHAVYDIELDSQNEIWLAATWGLYNINQDTTINYTSWNSELEIDDLIEIAIDENDNVYAASYHGLIKFNGGFETFNMANSEIPSNKVSSVSVFRPGAMAIGTRENYESSTFTYSGGGVAFLTESENGNEIDVLNKENSKLPSNYVNCVASDGNGNLFAGTNGGLYIRLKK